MSVPNPQAGYEPDLVKRLGLIAVNWESVAPGTMREAVIDAKGEVEKLSSLWIAETRENEKLRAEREASLLVQRNASVALDDARAEIEKLRADLASIRSVYDFAALEAKIAELRAALKPFAAWIDKVDTAAPSESTTDNNRTCLINGSAVVTYGDFRRAAQALEQKAGSSE